MKKQKRACERYQNIFEEKKQNIVNMIVNNIKIFLKMKIKC